MDLRLLETFQAVLEEGSLNAAAAKLGYAQSTVTQHIQQLEQQLCVQLFYREGKRLRISDGGVLLQKHGLPLLRRAQELKGFLEQFASGCGGSVRIGCVEPFVSTRLPAILREFMDREHSMEISVQVGATRMLYEELRAAKLDLIFAPSMNEYTDVIFAPLLFERLAFLIPRSHAYARKRQVSLAEIARERLILSGPLCEYRLAFEAAAAGLRERAPSPVTITSLDGRRAAAQSGLGIALVPLTGARPVPSQTFLRVPAEEDLGVTIGLARRADAMTTPAVHRFEGLVHRRLRKAAPSRA